jgi:hypothetical protein
VAGYVQVDVSGVEAREKREENFEKKINCNKVPMMILSVAIYLKRSCECLFYQLLQTLSGFRRAKVMGMH